MYIYIFFYVLVDDKVIIYSLCLFVILFVIGIIGKIIRCL